mmetsp:Transcript_41276/g.95250  ORF Transcript_41276/g.95250 Transcript_41276/m.95250 type:complete len:392 (-) Transcript_41276:246-1421(-)
MAKLFADAKRRNTQWIFEKTGFHSAEKDEQFDDTSQRFNQMADDLNELGAGIAASLKLTKQAFDVNEKLSRLVDKFYNGEYNREWPEVNTLANMRHHAEAGRFRLYWEDAHQKVRPSAAAICIERSLDRLRYFSNESVPKLKERVQERNNAELNFHSYQRRQASAAKKKPGSKELEHLNSKLEMTSKHFNEINGVLKDDILKEKLARDALVEESVITLLICQAEMYRDISSNLNDLVAGLPQEKVLPIQTKIKDMALTGGPVRRTTAGPSTLEKGAMIATGMATTSDYVKTQAEKDQEAAAAAARAVAAEEVARSEDAYRNQGRNPEAVAVNQSMGIKVKALFDCEAETDADLAFAVGDIIIVTSKDDSGWWEGTCNGKSGQFPANYVEAM